MPRLQEVLPVPCHQERQFVGLADGDLSLAVDRAAPGSLGQEGGHCRAVGPHHFEGVAVLRVAVLVLTSDLSPIVDKMTV